MPIYQYKCSECGHLMEALQKMSDPLLTDCPSCGESALRKQLTAAAFKLKGTGWYETDFKNSGKKPAAENPKKSSGDTAGATGKESAGTTETSKTSDSSTTQSGASAD